MEHSSFISELKKISRPHKELPFSLISSSRLLGLASLHHISSFQAQSLALHNKVLPERYLRNFTALDIHDQVRLAESSVLLVGLGGLGGYVLEILARTGVGSFTLADGDRFEESNLNRQILGTVDTLEKYKVQAAHERLQSINPFCRVRTIPYFLTRKELPELMPDTDLVVDALGGIEFRPVLLEETARAGLPLVTGFVAGTTGLASVIYAGDKDPSIFWEGKNEEGAENRLGNMAPMVSLIASVQGAEVIKLLTGKQSRLQGKVFLADFETLTFELLGL
ncbi:MAG: ThiF family adenylyltransferase [Desulfonatronovibrio sp.]